MKNVKDGYKMTELGEIPEEWDVKKLSEITRLIKDGTHNPPERTEEGIPLLSAENIFNNKINFGINEKNISQESFEDIHKGYSIEKNDVLLTCVGSIGRTAVVKDEPLFTIQRSVAIFKLCEGIDSYYFNYSLNSEYLQKQLKVRANTTAQAGIYLGELAKMNTIIPKLSEQHKISSILTSVDEQIEITDNLIEKTKKLKKGLMQKLLTKGIGHDRFKDTEIGRIPEEWEVFRIKDIADTTSGGTPSRTHKEYYENGTISWVKTGELNKKYIFDSEEKITEEAVLKSSAKLIPINSVLIAMYGATIGKTSISKKELTTNQACCAIICKEEVLNYESLYYILNFNKNSLIELGAGGAQPNISQMIVKEYKIAVPRIKEQKQIASVLSSVDEQIDQYESKKEKLQELKKGLMQKLLTGKIRVRV